MNKYILVINPGSTSTKVALFKRDKQILKETIIHPRDQIAAHPKLWDQFDLRKSALINFIETNNIKFNELEAVVGRGGLLKPLTGGTYLVNNQMLEDARKGLQGQHASNLGCALADSIARQAGVKSYVVDPVSVDEFEPLARYSGHPLIERRSLSHTLNIHAVGRVAANDLGVNYWKTNFIIAHLGGGISICPLKKGRIVDVNDASSSGPFSPERTGELPLQQFITLCYSGKYSETDIRKMVMGKGGLYAYLHTADAMEVENRIKKGDTKAAEIYQAMAYQISKEIGAMSTVVNGDVRAIVISGGLAKSKMLVDWITERVKFIAEVLVYPTEFEMQALAEGVVRVFDGVEKALVY
mgnify:CR=1 FL=1